jgi:hypothetical protein
MKQECSKYREMYEFCSSFSKMLQDCSNFRRIKKTAVPAGGCYRTAVISG